MKSKDFTDSSLFFFFEPATLWDKEKGHTDMKQIGHA